MYKRFFVKSGQADQKGHPVWIELTGREYYKLVKSDEGKTRFFMDMGDYVLECTKGEYREYLTEKEHLKYMNRLQKGAINISLFDADLFDGCNGEERIADQSENVEDAAINEWLMDQLHKAIAQLTEAEQELLKHFFFSNPKKTVRQISKELGLPVMTLQYRKDGVVKKLKRYMEQYR